MNNPFHCGYGQVHSPLGCQVALWPPVRMAPEPTCMCHVGPETLASATVTLGTLCPNLGPPIPDSPHHPPEARDGLPSPHASGAPHVSLTPRCGSHTFRLSTAQVCPASPLVPGRQERKVTSGSTCVPGIALSREASAGCLTGDWRENILVRKPWGLFIPIPTQRFFHRPGEPMGGWGKRQHSSSPFPGLLAVLDHSCGLR